MNFNNFFGLKPEVDIVWHFMLWIILFYFGACFALALIHPV